MGGGRMRCQERGAYTSCFVTGIVVYGSNVQACMFKQLHFAPRYVWSCIFMSCISCRLVILFSFDEKLTICCFCSMHEDEIRQKRHHKENITVGNLIWCLLISFTLCFVCRCCSDATPEAFCSLRFSGLCNGCSTCLLICSVSLSTKERLNDAINDANVVYVDLLQYGGRLSLSVSCLLHLHFPVLKRCAVP